MGFSFHKPFTGLSKSSILIIDGEINNWMPVHAWPLILYFLSANNVGSSVHFE